VKIQLTFGHHIYIICSKQLYSLIRRKEGIPGQVGTEQLEAEEGGKGTAWGNGGMDTPPPL